MGSERREARNVDGDSTGRVQRIQPVPTPAVEDTKFVRRLLRQHRDRRHSERRILEPADPAPAPRDQSSPGLLVLVLLLGVRAPQREGVPGCGNPIQLEKPRAPVAIEGKDAALQLETVPPDDRDDVRRILRNRDHVRVGDREAFGRSEEEQTVAGGGTSDRQPVLILVVRRLFVREKAVRRKAFVPIEVKGGTVRVLGARVGDDVDDPPGGSPVFRRERALDDLVLLHGVLGERRTNRPDRRIVVVQAVDENVVVARTLAVEGQAGSRGGARLRTAIPDDAWRSERKVDEVALIDRQVPDHGFADRFRNVRRSGIDERRPGRHRHGLGDGRDLQTKLQARGGAEQDANALHREWLETVEQSGDPVRRRGKQTDREISVAPGRCGPGQSRLPAGRRHEDSRKHGARLVRDSSPEITRRRSRRLGQKFSRKIPQARCEQVPPRRGEPTGEVWGHSSPAFYEGKLRRRRRPPNLGSDRRGSNARSTFR